MTLTATPTEGTIPFTTTDTATVVTIPFTPTDTATNTPVDTATNTPTFGPTVVNLPIILNSKIAPTDGW